MEWFKSWFDSPYYHLLYRDRDHSEAHQFIDRIIQFLAPDKSSHFLDLACGKGRHSVYLSNKGFRVTGADLSKQNIEYARQYATDQLDFIRHDMREPLPAQFDYVFNLFTSFGYFEHEEDNAKTIKAIGKELKANGVFVLDFLNAYRVVNELVPAEEKQVDDITFKINRKHDNHIIVKSIEFEAEGENHHYEERVTAFSRIELFDMLQAENLHVMNEFGDYDLSPYNQQASPRLILIAEKA